MVRTHNSYIHTKLLKIRKEGQKIYGAVGTFKSFGILFIFKIILFYNTLLTGNTFTKHENSLSLSFNFLSFISTWNRRKLSLPDIAHIKLNRKMKVES